MKLCRRCGETKSLEEFYKAPQCKQGRRPECKECSENQHKTYRSRPEVKARISSYMRTYDYNPTAEQRGKWAKKAADRHASSPRNALSLSRCNALGRRPTENPISIDELVQMWERQKGLCAISGIQMTWRKDRLKPTSMSIDRIDWRGGYEAGNVRLICHAINVFRGRMTDAEMLTMARAIVAKADAESNEPTWRSWPAYQENALCA